MKNPIKIFWLAEFVVSGLLISGSVPDYFAYLFLIIMIVGILRLSDLDALRLYIYSIPIFVSLPANFLSEAMSVWRFAILFLALKVFLEKFEVLSILGNRGLVLSDKKSQLLGRFSDFLEDIKSSNYYSIFYPVVLLGAVSLVSLVYAQSLGAGMKKIIFLASVFLLFSIVSFAVRSREDAMKVLKSVFVSGLFIMAVGYLQLLSTFFIFLADFWGAWDNYVIKAFYGERTMMLLSYSNTWFSYYDATGDIPPTLRMFSVMPDSHSFSMLMILFAPLALFYAYTHHKKFDRRYLFVFALMLLAIFFSGSRGAWVGWAGALAAAAYFYLYPRIPGRLKALEIKNHIDYKNIYRIVFASVMLFVVMFPVSSFVLSANQDSQLIREGRVLEGGKRNALLQRTWSISDFGETSNKGRMEIWRDSLVSVSRHPLVGIGMGNFPIALSEKVSTAKMGSSAHNIYLDVAVELGILGLIIFVLLVLRICGKLLNMSWKFKEEKFRLLAFAFLVYFIWIFTYGFFDVVILNDKVLMFVVIIVAILCRMEDMEEKGIFADSKGKNG